jgi:simple sugar transport system ATP-binding protein
VGAATIEAPEARGAGAGEAPALELSGITKRFGAVVANDRVDFVLARGEVLGVLGENGAGKSTLMNIVSGLVSPDEGTIRRRGRTVAFSSPRDAIDAGIGMVHQHFMLVPTLTVVENVMLGDRRLPRARLDRTAAAEAVTRIAADIGLTVGPWALVGTLDIGERQRVEILKALSRNAEILILDEPTTVLTKPEREGLYEMIRRLSAAGVSVILISHKFEDIFEVCHRVLVMRGGRVVDAAPLGARTREELVRAMVGGDIAPPSRAEEGGRGPRLVAVEGLAVDRDDGAPAFREVGFALHAGEILAVAGVEGNGQRELAEALTGLRRAVTGTIDYAELGDARPSVRALRRLGVRHVPQDRHANGMLVSQSLVENFLLSHFFAPEFNRGGWLSRGAAVEQVRRAIATFDVRAPGPGAPAASLSGGNQQKLVLARELALSPRVLVAAHPTRGLDVRTTAFVLEQLLRLRREGIGIVLFSSDLGEIWEVADRVMVLSHGHMRGPVALAETTVQQVGAWLAGA